MSNPTSNFGWQMPTPVDLVTDLPADFEVFGQAVDSTLADLKGGTSGQVLSKNSNTDMDFVWTSPNPGDITAVTAGTGISGGGTSGDVTITNSMATAIDAKGDLIAGTGADAFSRLASGANGTMLVANSAESTGLKWTTATDQYPWTAYTSSPANITVGNGTLTARYQQIGKTVNVELYFQLGSTSAVSGLPTFTLPVSAKVSNYTLVGVAGFADFGVATFPAVPVVYSSFFYIASMGASETYVKENGNVSATAPFTWTTNDTMIARFTYEAA